MAELILSALLPIVFEKLASAAVKKIARAKEIDSELKKWRESLSMIQDVLNDAAEKEVTEAAVKRWLNRLHHLAYDIDDILDDMATEAMHREFTNESEATTSKLRKLIPTCCTCFSLSTTSMDGKLSDITTRLQELVDEKNNLGLIVRDGRTKNKNRNQETSSKRETIVGRDGDKEILLPKLLGGEPCSQNFSIVAIVGMGGMGKTTLARLLYNDKLVKDHFDHKAWVCVSEDFDSFKISKEIFQSVSGETQKFESLDLLQKALEDRLMGKRFLIVLDDVWSDKLEDWETLAGPFYKGAPGSKIIITTRKTELLRRLHHVHQYDLQKLSHDDALCLFAQHAGLDDFDSYEAQRKHAEGIVQKCAGLPLAIKALGSLLRTKADEEEWKDVLNNDLWKLKDGGVIVPALRLSYQDLSARLKQLFAYCSLLPKDYVFKKEDLILKWMAEGFLHQSDTNTSMERLGDKCFQELLSKSFFQHVPGDDKSLFMMHDLMNDLATLVAGEFIIRLDIGMEKDDGEEVLKRYRHMSFVPERYTTYNKLKSFRKANSLRTFLAVPIVVGESWHVFNISSKILVDLLPKLPLLRVLCLSKLEIDEVPESVGNMKHLRYLNLSQNRITHLPDNVCNLINLQTLIVSGCEMLTKLPDNLKKLKSLRHFDIRDTFLWNMLPEGMDKLKGLQILSNIIVGENDNFPISGLRNLKNLQGKIYIRGLEQVKSARDIREVKLSQKRVSGLELEWRDVFDDSRNETLENEVLSALMPHSENLEDLSIKSYGDKVFPNWLGDSKFVRLSCISLSRCRNCTRLPPLGNLPSLKKLFIKDLDEVKDVGSEFVGAGSGPAFPSLESLRFEDMRGWKVWSTTVGGGVGAVFPCLQELTLRNCPNLAVVSLKPLPSLRVLKISDCGDGVLRSLIRVASSVTMLSIEGISGLTDEVWRDTMEQLGAVEELSIRKCNEIKYMWESEAEASKVLVNIRKLEVWNCEELVSLGEKEEENDNSGCNHLTSLKNMVLWSCKNLERFSCPDNIESLFIWGCGSITCVSFPTGGCQKLKSLTIKFCNQLSEKELEKVFPITITSMLEVVYVSYWPNLKSVNELTNKFIRLTQLFISDCSRIESFPADVLPTFTSLKRLSIFNCKNMDVASFGLWPPNLGFLQIGALKKPISQWSPQTFPTSLVHLILDGGSGEEDDVTGGSQLSHMLPSSLTNLKLWEFEKLETVSKGLQHLTSLQHLQIRGCPKMKDLPEELLPSLLSLWLIKCPDELKEKISRRGSYWPRISYIPHVRIE
ncbi:NB-ARC domains-containing protein [Artemisia annua]|uniref:NB-ARC domains-containing protein n=1 Tax=Artemisia annua TaxID=35608 RepID=A0A2U1KK51_ARTAN|nr:NB-ARC domains-containing protein [Artemisia annua]